MRLPGVVPGLQHEGEAGTAVCQIQLVPAWGKKGTMLLAAANWKRNSPVCTRGR